MTDSLISILMPVKNSAPFLQMCLDSILAQTNKLWELIAVDDHSTDESRDLLDQYGKRDRRIKILSNQGEGIIPALQTAYKKAKGQFITRMDSDDTMTPIKLQLMSAPLMELGCGHIVLGLVDYFSQGKLGEGYRRYAEWLNQCTIEKRNFKCIYKECSIPSSCWMVARSDFEKAGAFQPLVYPEDYDLAFRFKKQGLKIVAIREILHNWRDHDTRTSRTHWHYADNRYTALKVHHFLSQDRSHDKPLIVWGAGKKGKDIVLKFTEHKIDLNWICNNENKIGHKIYNHQLLDISLLERVPESQVVLAVSARGANKEIKQWVEKTPQHQYFYFT